MTLKFKADTILNLCNKKYPFGSSNIKDFFYHQATDSFQVHDDLLTRENSRTIDALIDQNLKALMDGKLREMRDIIRDDTLNTLEFNARSVSQKRYLIRSKIASLSSRAGIGNCEELATYCFMSWIANYGVEDDIEMAFFQHNDIFDRFPSAPGVIDHIFVIIGRKKFGANAVILDAWINKVFYLGDLSDVWRKNIFQIPFHEMQIVPKFSGADFMLLSS